MPQVQLAEFDQLMAHLAAGSEEAAWELTERYTPHILRAVRASLPSKMRRLVDSQDFTQAVWASLLMKRVQLGRIENEHALIGYLARTAKNKVIDACRRHIESQKRDIGRDRTLASIKSKQTRGVQRLHPTEDEHEPFSRDESPSQCAILRERWRAILSAESPRCRQILECRLKGQSFATIAAELDIHEGTARRAMLRLLNKLAQ